MSLTSWASEQQTGTMMLCDCLFQMWTVASLEGRRGAGRSLAFLGVGSLPVLSAQASVHRWGQHACSGPHSRLRHLLPELRCSQCWDEPLAPWACPVHRTHAVGFLILSDSIVALYPHQPEPPVKSRTQSTDAAKILDESYSSSESEFPTQPVHVFCCHHRAICVSPAPLRSSIRGGCSSFREPGENSTDT